MEKELRLSKGKVFEQLTLDTGSSQQKSKGEDKKGNNHNYLSLSTKFF